MVGTGFLTRPILLRFPLPLYCLPPPPLFQNFSNPFLSLLPLNCTPLLFLLSFFFGCMGDHATFDAPLNDIMDLCISLMPYYQKDLAVCLMQQRVKFTEIWHMWFFAGALIWYRKHMHTHMRMHTNKHTRTHPQTHRNTAGSGDNRLTHPYKYILTPTAICNTLNNSLYQKFTFHGVFSFQKLLTCRSHISVH